MEHDPATCETKGDVVKPKVEIGIFVKAISRITVAVLYVPILTATSYVIVKYLLGDAYWSLVTVFLGWAVFLGVSIYDGVMNSNDS